MTTDNPLGWLTQPITRLFGNGEAGLDFGAPFHSPIALPYGGTVTNVTTGGWGQEVDVATSVPGLGSVTESLVHLDQALVHVGQTVQPGEVIGLSGGQLSGGLHNATPTYSSGPHVEYDLWRGTPWASRSVNPTSYLPGQGGKSPTIVSADLGSGVQRFLSGLVQWVKDPGQAGINVGTNAAITAGGGNSPFGIFSWLGTTSRDFFARAGLVMIALLLIGAAVLAVTLGVENKQTNVSIALPAGEGE